MQIITLTTDNGYHDYYVAAIKGRLLKAFPSAHVIDISHGITPFNIGEAAFQLRCCFHEFAEGTIHIIGVDSEPLFEAQKERYPGILKYKGQYFICNDNGFFGSFLEEDFPDEFYHYTAIQDQPEAWRFTTKNCFIDLAQRIVNKEELSSFATAANSYRRAFDQKPILDPLLIRGVVIHIDSFGNLVTNITKTDFERFGTDIPFTIKYQKKEYFIDEISATYNAVTQGERVALFNSAGRLEIAINRGANDGFGGASKLFGMRIGDPVHIEFTPQGSKENIQSLF
ncbi:MAG: SAM-dependent chlorinase/fluorinase [Crocinitomicaceae bacterium]|jgi:S-adenosyl-L-methionine hydrolase (adenosine-forming)|nr:SAM-dependent chlorinase/fluorinase [Crocinitomicaceae bacterium]MDP4724439.1 SAM-dependent chlorinase/fluorinase [Crocinitomicaceae bacterium]MDP4738646.1 SAM-dependent chlorinase/fluorinase [Crocinitomicaceae bacterium]MDP4800057.1 SAM-dependent chlorinase/fluorinase [Crocinitomicaceae bacterium]MDP4806481.1 SAM-dependent chlorinase/fluorinase [Crocinitomicaceae bacterium]